MVSERDGAVNSEQALGARGLAGEGDGGAVAVFALDVDCAVVFFYYGVADGEAEARAADGVLGLAAEEALRAAVPCHHQAFAAPLREGGVRREAREPPLEACAY